MIPTSPALALTMGEPAGIGAEIALAAWAARDARTPPFFLIDDPDRLRRLASSLGHKAAPREIADPAGAPACFADALPVLPQKLAAPVTPGKPDPANAATVLSSIRRAVAHTLAGRAAAVVTNPIQKSVLRNAGFKHPGHTEFLAELTASPTPPAMMLVCPGLRVVPVTVHLPLRAVAGALTRGLIRHHGEVAAAALRRDFGIDRPRLAAAALNPHAGEDGLLGREEREVIAPALGDLRAAGIDIAGPLPADTLFHAGRRGDFDAVLCMYHDQALIPLKTLDFHHGVNVTLGLPIVRTSPDHGTALDIAGQGKADPASLIAALQLAAAIAARRFAATEPGSVA
ncbi:MAG: 4-hydroxythreonine-4-phosphate dehydrogenase PdxA [Alphaproteobacteria bacterium]